MLVKINEGSHEGLADLGDQLRDGCELLACLDYVIEEASTDVSLAKWYLILVFHLKFQVTVVIKSESS